MRVILQRQRMGKLQQSVFVNGLDRVDQDEYLPLAPWPSKTLAA